MWEWTAPFRFLGRSGRSCGERLLPARPGVVGGRVTLSARRAPHEQCPSSWLCPRAARRAVLAPATRGSSSETCGEGPAVGPEDTWPSRARALPAAGQAGVRPLGPLGPRESARELSGPKRFPPRAARTGPRKERRAPHARPARRPAGEPRAARPRRGRAARRPPRVRCPTGAQPDPKKPVRDPRGVGEALHEESPTSGVGGRFPGSTPHLAGCLQPVHPALLLGHTAGQLRQLPQPP